MNDGWEIDWHSYSPYDVLPRASIKVAIDYLNEGIKTGIIVKDSKGAAKTYFIIAKSMFAYGDPGAFQYLIRSSGYAAAHHPGDERDLRQENEIGYGGGIAARSARDS